MFGCSNLLKEYGEYVVPKNKCFVNNYVILEASIQVKVFSNILRDYVPCSSIMFEGKATNKN